MRAFENVHQNGNYTRLLAAEVDRYLPASERWIGEDPRTVIRVGSFKRMPIMMGICSNEGAFLRDQWLELGRESYAALDGYVRKTLVPNALEMMGFQDGGFNESLTRQLINWRFFEQIPKDVPSLLAAMQLFLSETRFERPFFETLELLIKPEKFNAISEARALVSSDRSAEDEVNVIVDAQQMSEFSADQDPMEHRMRSDTETDYAPNRRIPSLEPSKQVPSSAHPSLFAYTFQQSHSIDLRGRPNFFGGAAHTTDLLFLMGPNLYQQVGRRRLTVTEEKLCKRMRQTFSDFVKTGNPTPGRLFDAWLPYNANHRFIQPLGSADGIGSSNLGTASVTTGKRAGIDEITNRLSFVQQNRVQIAEMLNGDGGQPGVVVSSGGMAVNPYSIGQRKIDAGTMTSSRHSKSYLPGDPSDSAASIVMARASAFWTEVLPHVYEQQQLLSRHNAANVGQVATGSVVSADMASKFRHAFFAMLALVCVLLAMLGVCVYMLRKGHRRTIDTSYLWHKIRSSLFNRSSVWRLGKCDSSRKRRRRRRRRNGDRGGVSHDGNNDTDGGGGDEPVQLRAKNAIYTSELGGGFTMAESTRAAVVARAMGGTPQGEKCRRDDFGARCEPMDSMTYNDQFEVRNWRYHLTSERFWQKETIWGHWLFFRFCLMFRFNV